MEIGIKDMIKNINNWKNAPTWNTYNSKSHQKVVRISKINYGFF